MLWGLRSYVFVRAWCAVRLRRYNAASGVFTDMVKAGIIDPLKVREAK